MVTAEGHWQQAQWRRDNAVEILCSVGAASSAASKGAWSHAPTPISVARPLHRHPCRQFRASPSGGSLCSPDQPPSARPVSL